MLNGAGEQGHIFAGKYCPFNNYNIVMMLGVYILNRLAPSQHLVQKMQLQSKSRTHSNDKIRIATAHGAGYQQKCLMALCSICMRLTS